MPTNTHFLVACKMMIDQLLARGQRPLTFLMNGNTAQVIAADLAEAHFNKQSALARFWHLVRHGKTVPKLETLYGVAVQQSDFLPDGRIHLQAMADMSQQSLDEAMKAAAQAQAQQNQARGQEFWQKDRVDPPAATEGDVAPTLSDIAGEASDRPSVSSILIEAMADADSLDSVVVVRVHKNHDVSLCLNCNSFEAQGILQKAQFYLAQRGM